MRNERNQEEIIDIAARLFRTKGYKGTSLNDIADELGIKKGSLYYYINSKEELLVKVTKKGMPLVISPLEEIISLEISSREKLERAIRTHLESFEICQDHAVVALIERRFLPALELEDYLRQRKRYETLFQQIIEEGIQNHEFQKLNAKMLTFSILGMLNSTSHWYRKDHTWTLKELANFYCELIIKRILHENVSAHKK